MNKSKILLELNSIKRQLDNLYKEIAEDGLDIVVSEIVLSDTDDIKGTLVLADGVDGLRVFNWYSPIDTKVGVVRGLLQRLSIVNPFTLAKENKKVRLYMDIPYAVLLENKGGEGVISLLEGLNQLHVLEVHSLSDYQEQGLLQSFIQELVEKYEANNNLSKNNQGPT